MKEIKTQKGIITIVDSDKVIKDGIDFLELVYSTNTDIIIINKENLDKDFFDLSTKIAGDILQKASNYSIKLIILGDFEAINSQSLKDFIYESNKAGKIIFEKSLDDAIALLK